MQISKEKVIFFYNEFLLLNVINVFLFVCLKPFLLRKVGIEWRQTYAAGTGDSEL